MDDGYWNIRVWGGNTNICPGQHLHSMCHASIAWYSENWSHL